jgi:hypothetical protein
MKGSTGHSVAAVGCDVLITVIHELNFKLATDVLKHDVHCCFYFILTFAGDV